MPKLITHTVGDLPYPIQVSDGNENDESPKRFIIIADTSFSGDTKWISNDSNERENLGRGNAVSGRGDAAVSEILLEQCRETGKIVGVFTHGVLSDGSSYESVNFQEESEGMIGKLVDRSKLCFEGSVQDDSCDEVDWFVKSKFNDGTYLVSTSKGYEVYNSIASKKKD